MPYRNAAWSWTYWSTLKIHPGLSYHEALSNMVSCRYPVPCNVSDGKFYYYFGGTPNPYWFMFTISNTR
jgi:hypothetical protein